MKAKVLFILLPFMSLIGCSSTDKTHISQTDLLHKIAAKQPPVIIDVRSESEYKSGHIPGAVHIPFWSAFATEQLDDYPKQTELVLYCAHGPRAGIAKMAFYFAGFENMRYLQGHMTAWYDAHLPVETIEK